MADPNNFREQAARCRRLAPGLQDNDPIKSALLALALEFEAKAAAPVPPSASTPHIGAGRAD